MFNQIHFIRKPEILNHYTNDGKIIQEFDTLQKINLFVGANNSGKSRLMRFILKTLHIYEGPDFNFASPFSFDGPVPTLAIHQISVTQFQDRFCADLKKIQTLGKKPRWLKESSVIKENDFINEHQLWELLRDIQSLKPNFENNDNYKNDALIMETLSRGIKDDCIAEYNINPRKKFLVTYVPTSRTLRKFIQYEKGKEDTFPKSILIDSYKPIETEVLRHRAFYDFFIEPAENKGQESKTARSYNPTLDFFNIFSGESLYDKIHELRNNTEEQREILTGFENFLSSHFFNHEKVEINALKKDKIQDIFVKIGKEKEFPIYQLGDGIQSIILLTFPLFYFKNNPNHVIFYEEPELYLHPGMQRIFVEVLRSFDNVQAFIVTHSNHILDTSLDYKDDMAIFSFEKSLNKNQGNFKIETLSTPDLSLLNLLGVRNSSIFLSNCCIWVEGISDRIYIKKYLELLMAQAEYQKPGMKTYYEDLHFSFLEYGGNQVVHYDFSSDVKSVKDNKIKATRITNRILLIHDQDKNKVERHELLTNQLGEHYLKLNCLEIENLISPQILMSTLKEYQKTNADILEFKVFDQADYEMKPIGEFIVEIIKGGVIKKICSEGTSTVTSKLLNKADFALKATEHMLQWNDLSQSAKDLTIKVYDFIQSHNKN